MNLKNFFQKLFNQNFLYFSINLRFNFILFKIFKIILKRFLSEFLN